MDRFVIVRVKQRGAAWCWNLDAIRKSVSARRARDSEFEYDLLVLLVEDFQLAGKVMTWARRERARSLPRPQ